MVDVIVDERGFERRCGSLPMPVNRVCSLPPFGSDPNMPLWTEAEIKAVVTRSDRERSRDLFGAAWILDQLSFGSCNGHKIIFSIGNSLQTIHPVYCAWKQFFILLFYAVVPTAPNTFCFGHNGFIGMHCGNIFLIHKR